MPLLSVLAEYLDTLLAIETTPDYLGAVNGVQLANLGDIQHVATAVDFSSETVDAAINAGARMLLVHHGMFWGGVQPITGPRHQRIWSLMMHDVAVYSAHLPLDRHPELGNNVLLARRMGLEVTGAFARYQTIDIGVSGDSNVDTKILVDRASALADEFGGKCIATRFDANRVTRRWGICTGAGASSASILEAVDRGLDTLVVGEGPHHTAVEAHDRDIVIIYAGHYATETLGVRALGDQLATRFGVTSTFIHAPSGL